MMTIDDWSTLWDDDGGRKEWFSKWWLQYCFCVLCFVDTIWMSPHTASIRLCIVTIVT
jgi:hypothetical protein